MMSRFKRYLTALRRYNRSRGFGIHSPFAFYFVRRVLRERCHYYAYEQLTKYRHVAHRLIANRKATKTIISQSNARMLFRITCYFAPSHVLQIGSTYGVSTMAMLTVSNRSSLTIFTGSNTCNDVFSQVTASESHRIKRFGCLDETLGNYDRLREVGGFVLINNIEEDEIELLLPKIKTIIEEGGVVVMRNLAKSIQMKHFWGKLNASISHGMTFSNYRIGIIVGLKHLPRQNYILWF